MTTATRFPFTVEVKRREAWKLDRLLDGKTSPVWEWWRQACAQGEEMAAIPMLWVRQNRDLWRVVVPWDAIPRSFSGAVHEWAPWAIEDHDLPREPAMVRASVLLLHDPRIFAPMRSRGKTKS